MIYFFTVLSFLPKNQDCVRLQLESYLPSIIKKTKLKYKINLRKKNFCYSLIQDKIYLLSSNIFNIISDTLSVNKRKAKIKYSVFIYKEKKCSLRKHETYLELSTDTWRLFFEWYSATTNHGTCCNCLQCPYISITLKD